MAVGSATLPAGMISYQAGTTIKKPRVSRRYLLRCGSLDAVPVIGGRLTTFRRGPNVDAGISPT
jgi:hypothetical protein